jgi:prepilin-type N-terminal cleavage/methylation domain-containing protein
MTRKAFTLIELIVVIAIIAVLASVIAPSAFRSIEKAKISRATVDMKAIKTAAMAFYSDTGAWPLRGIDDDSRSSGKGFVTDDDGYGNPVPGWDGPYLQKWSVNPWGAAGSSWGSKYYWDASDTGDDNNNGIFPEAQVIMFNVPRKSAQTLDDAYDNGVLIGANVGNIYQNTVVNGNPNADPLALNWMVMEPIE